MPVRAGVGAESIERHFTSSVRRFHLSNRDERRDDSPDISIVRNFNIYPIHYRIPMLQFSL